jgi:rare lipoprotein A
MRRSLLVRQLALAAFALLAGVGAVAGVARTGGNASRGPQAIGSYTALAGSAGPAAFGRTTSCGLVLRPATEGVVQPTLPCGTRLLVTYRGRTALTEVVGRGPYGSGRQLDLTDALARRLGLRGVQRVRWAYAR